MTTNNDQNDKKEKQIPKVNLKSGDIVIAQGESSTSLFYLEQGTLGVFKDSHDGKDEKMVQIGTIYAGELVGEISFLDQKPRSATVKCLTDAILIEIPAHKFQDIFNSLPKWYQALIQTLLDRLRTANEKIAT